MLKLARICPVTTSSSQLLLLLKEHDISEDVTKQQKETKT